MHLSNGAIFASLLFLMIFAQPALASDETTVIDASYCANDTYLTVNSTMYLLGMVNGTSVVESGSFSYDALCVNGCSDTLGACRADRYTEMILVLATLAAFIMFIWVASRLKILALASLIISAVVSVVIFTTDMFSADINGLFLIFPLAILVYGSYQAYLKSTEEKEEEEYDY